MRNEGTASIWVGTAGSLDILEGYLHSSYTPDGDYIPPPFAQDFGIRYFDDDFREAEHFAVSTDSICDLLDGFSYDSTMIPKLIDLVGDRIDRPYNAVVVLYNFKYVGTAPVEEHDGVRLVFIGSIAYS